MDKGSFLHNSIHNILTGTRNILLIICINPSVLNEFSFQGRGSSLTLRITHVQYTKAHQRLAAVIGGCGKVTPYTDIANIEWGKYGQWSPTEGLEANLEAAYTFSCTETPAEAALNPYANWYCDFYVSLDEDLGANQIFLGGNYGSFGWVGFHNGDLTLTANTEIGLLEGVTTNPWTYLDVANYVGTFICGVGDVDDALADATFTVKLRLTNPDNASEYYDIETINYTFTKVVNSGDELQDAVNNGIQNIELGGDIDLGNGDFIIP